MMHTAVVVRHRIDQRITLDQDEAGIRLILFGYAPIREHNTPQPGFDISAAKDGSRSEVEQDCYLF